MAYQSYLKERKEVYDIILQFIEDSNNENSDFNNLIKHFDKLNVRKNIEEITLFLHLIIQISNNHHRTSNFYNKIEQILQYFFESIKNNFSNIEIFNLVKSNKLIVLYFIEQKVIIVDEQIVKEIKYCSQQSNSKYHYFFYPEIKNFLNKEELNEIEKELDFDILSNFDHKRHIGENETKLCEMIRNDSIVEFVSCVNKTNLSISNTIIQPSIFETNSYLIKNRPTLIEYAAFYGSIQIFQYLNLNHVELTSNLWIYSIHSQNADLIHILEGISVDPPLKSYVSCFLESIKCHHNSIANYFQDMHLNQNNLIDYKNAFHFYNFNYIPIELKNNEFFYYICRYGYSDLIDLYLKPDQEKFNDIKNNLKKEIQKAITDDNTEFIYLLLKLENNDISNEFMKSTTLNKISIPPNITKINNSAFINCSSLKQVYISSSVKSIENNSFSNCISLMDVFIPSSVTSIGINAFRSCSSLKKISIPSSVTSIGNSAFEYCTSLTQISIPPSVTSIENFTFRGCSSLAHITIPSSVASIGDSAFYECSSLSQVSFEISSSLTLIGYSAFSGCSSLTQMSIPSSVISIKSFSFEKCSSIKEVTFEIPSSLTSIGDSAFYKCSLLKQISIPSSVISIGNSAFYECVSLEQMLIPSSVTLIDNCTFYGCSLLKQISIPFSVTSIGKGAFSGCLALEQISIPSSVTSIGSSAFYKCLSLEQIEISSSVTKIDQLTFSKCSSLKNVTIPSSVTLISVSSFSECSSLEQITIPSSVTKIEKDAFKECSSLARISIPSLTKIDHHAFWRCNLLDDLCDSDSGDDITKDEDSSSSIILFFISLSSILLIITFIWWLRIHPWFLHGYSTGKKVYILLEISWISALILFLCGLLIKLNASISKCRLAIYMTKRKLIYKITRYLNMLYLLMIFGLYFASNICAIMASTYTFKNEKIDGKSIKCMNYIFNGYNGALDWASNQSLKVQNDLQKWHSEMLNKMYKNNGEISNYYCLGIGVPAFLIAIISFISSIILIIITIFILYILA